MNTEPMWIWEDVVRYIRERCFVSEEDIEIVLELEDEYMRSIGLIVAPEE